MRKDSLTFIASCACLCCFFMIKVDSTLNSFSFSIFFLFAVRRLTFSCSNILLPFMLLCLKTSRCKLQTSCENRAYELLYSFEVSRNICCNKLHGESFFSFKLPHDHKLLQRNQHAKHYRIWPQSQAENYNLRFIILIPNFITNKTADIDKISINFLLFIFQTSNVIWFFLLFRHKQSQKILQKYFYVHFARQIFISLAVLEYIGKKVIRALVDEMRKGLCSLPVWQIQRIQNKEHLYVFRYDTLREEKKYDLDGTGISQFIDTIIYKLLNEAWLMLNLYWTLCFLLGKLKRNIKKHRRKQEAIFIDFFNNLMLTFWSLTHLLKCFHLHHGLGLQSSQDACTWKFLVVNCSIQTR